MGVGLFGKPSGSVADKEKSSYSAPVPPNPNPRNYKIDSHVKVNGFLVMKVSYPGCTSFEGMKILVFPQKTTLLKILAQKVIDPHFSDSKDFIHPVARFIPTAEGVKMAISFCKNWKLK